MELSSLRADILLQVQQILDETDLTRPEGILSLQNHFNAMVDRLAESVLGESDSRRICADEIALTVVDKTTGRLYRRALPVGFEETDNALRLLGETFRGEPAEIVLLSNTAVARINDLTGQGPEKPRCD